MTKNAGDADPTGRASGIPGDVAPISAPLDPRALRVSVALDHRLPGDESIMVSPAPVPVRPLRSEFAETGPFGGIAHGTREGAGSAGPDGARPDTGSPDAARRDAARSDAARSDAARPDAARPTDDASIVGDPESRPSIATGGPPEAREVAADEPAMLLVDGRPRRIRLERIDAEHAILELDDARPDGPRAGGPAPEPLASPSGTPPDGGPTRLRIVLGPSARRRADGVVVQEVVVDGWRFELELESERRAALRDRARRGHESAGHAGPMEIHAIIPGRIVAISVSPGEAVEAGQQLLVEEAMKMQNELRAPREGEIERIAVAVGQTVDVGDLLMVIS